MKKFLFISFSLFFSQTSFACKFVQIPIEEKLKNSEVVFIGIINKDFDFRDGNKIVTLGNIHVEKAIKGVDDNKNYSLSSHNSSCGLSFRKGQKWLILGNKKDNVISSNAPDGSLLLEDNGVVLKDNSEYINQLIKK